MQRPAVRLRLLYSARSRVGFISALPLSTSPASPSASRKCSTPVSVRWYATQQKSNEQSGTSTPVTDVNETAAAHAKSPFYFEAGYALFAKRPSRPFPPPFLSKPSSSFSDPLSTHNQSRDRRSMKQWYNNEVIRGITNGDDAVLVSENFVAANDGVGAWAQKERGHAALWSRLIAHFWSLETDRAMAEADDKTELDPKSHLQRAYELTKEATTSSSEWYGTTTASGALITSDNGSPAKPCVIVTQLGDSSVLVIRPSSTEVLYKTTEQWHWFDCPRQLGTNSPDTPDGNAVVEKVEVELGDVVLALSDGVSDNLWEHEVVDNVLKSLKESNITPEHSKEDQANGMKFVAQQLVKAAMVIAQDPFAESPFMERAIEEGLPTEGGKLDDISVVAAICRKRPG